MDRKRYTRRRRPDDVPANDHLTIGHSSRTSPRPKEKKGPVNRSELKRACLGHGWPTIHRVKEHIQRCHIPAAFINTFACNRCHESFVSQDLLFQHQRQEDPCPINVPETTVGKITLEQATKLGAKKKKTNMSDEMRWFVLYDIIFPDQEPAQRPSTPYHQPLANQTLNNLSALAPVSISSYRDTFIGPSVQTKKRRLEGKLKHWGVADPGFRQTLAAKVQEYQFQELQDFMRRMTMLRVRLMMNPKRHTLTWTTPGLWASPKAAQQTSSTGTF
ncbi:uncharacterized protein FFFS_14235 [Fusarium fujikuroi]|nr:uncharacterized protein FFC1_12946 [Fusarium fujikuroi]SCV59666.1 uncharacterized protein FFFS_14235 [Fusarium fujikuroi]